MSGEPGARVTTVAARAALAAVCAPGSAWGAGPFRAPAPGTRARRAAVLVLFGVLDDAPARSRRARMAPDLDVLLTRRAATLSHHAGQVSFPGGRLEASDDGPVDAALREAVEETGLDPDGIEVLGTLPALPVTASDHVVTPVVSWWTAPSQVAVVDRGETVAVFRAPVADLLDPERRRTATITVGPTTYRSPAFLVDEHVVWGFTAAVLDHLFDALGWTEPWDASRTVPAPI